MMIVNMQAPRSTVVRLIAGTVPWLMRLVQPKRTSVMGMLLLIWCGQ